MLLKYGTYAYQLFAAGVVINSRAELNGAQEPVWKSTTVEVMTRLKNPGTTRASMNTAVETFLAAHSRSGRDLILYQPDGTRTIHAWVSANTIGGVRIVSGPSFPEYAGAEAINYRTITVGFEIVEPITDARSALRSFTETLRTSGGGPKHGYLEPLNAPPQKQLLKQFSIYKAVQSGTAIGLYAQPTPPPPIWPSALMEAPEIEDGGCNRIGDTLVDFAISWSYRFESDSPLRGRANRWPALK